MILLSLTTSSPSAELLISHLLVQRIAFDKSAFSSIRLWPPAFTFPQTAYVAKSADVLSLLLGLPTEWSGVAFVGFFGALLLIGGTTFIDYANQAATGVMLTLFAIMVR